MKKFFSLLFAIIITLSLSLTFTACGVDDAIYVDTNAFFAPFEYYDGTEIKGVDVDIMNMVGEKLGKKVVITNTDFGVIIDNVASGKQFDCGAAGITVTDARKERVDFSNAYFTSVQYVILKEGSLVKDGTYEGVDYILWESLSGLKIGVQTDTTGDIFLDGEINATVDNEDYGYDGVLYGTNTKEVRYDSAQLAVAGLQANSIDAVIVDKIPAEYLVSKNDGLVCFALHYDEATATSESYAICVTKGNTELLNAINSVLEELGKEGIDALVSKHLGLGD